MAALELLAGAAQASRESNGLSFRKRQESRGRLQGLVIRPPYARAYDIRQTARARERGDRMIATLKRREFMALVAAAWPLTARAQQREAGRRLSIKAEVQ